MIFSKIFLRSWKSNIFLFIILMIIFLFPTLSVADDNINQSNKTLQVKSISFKDVRVTEYTEGKYYKKNTNEEINYWFKYDITNWNYTVTLNNGDVIEHTSKDDKLGFYVNGIYYEPEFSSNQSVSSPWNLNKVHKVNVTLGTVKTTYLFFIQDNRVQSIEFEPMYAYKNTNGKMETTSDGNKWFHYNTENWNYTVKFYNGDIIKHSEKDKKRGFYRDGVYYDIYFSDSQTYKRQWNTGSREIYGAIGLCWGFYDYEIWKYKIKNIYVSEKIYVKEESQYKVTEEIDNTGRKVSYYKYPVVQHIYTVTMENGDKIKCTSEESRGVHYKGKTYPVTFSSDQSPYNQWGVGTHRAQIQCGPYKTTYKITIVPHKNLVENDYKDQYYISGNYAYIIRKREANIIAYFGEEKEVKIPSKLDGLKVTKILQRAFYENHHIQRLIIPNGVTTLDNESIAFCDKLKYIYIPASVYDVAGYNIGAIIYNPNLDTIDISSKNKILQNVNGTIYDKAMKNLIMHPPALKVEKLVIPKGVQYILSDSCRENLYLKEVVMPDSVLEINYWAFDGCSNLEKINISKNCYFIGQFAFSRTGIKKIHLPATLCNLLDDLDMPNLESITVDKNNPKLFSVDGVLYGEGKTNDKEYILRSYPAAKKGKEYVVLKGTTMTTDGAFQYAKYLEKITFPKEFSKIENRAFYNCENLKTLVFHGKIKSLGDNVFSNDENIKSVYILGDFPSKMKRLIREIGSTGSTYKIIYTKGNKEFENYVKNNPKRTSSWKTVSKSKANSMYKESYPNDCVKVGRKHIYRKRPLNRASYEDDGKLVNVCSRCGKEGSKKTLPKVTTIKLSWTKKTYTGKSIQAPKITVKDKKGKVLKENIDYTLYEISNKVPVGIYEGCVQLEGRYKGSENVYYIVVPRAPKRVNAELYGYNDVKVSWSKSKGATGYTIYYKASKDKKYIYLTRTSKRYVKFSNLTDGRKYDFKIIPYYKPGEQRYTGLTSTTDSVYTLKEIKRPKVKKEDGNVKISWKNISGETGYQISRSKDKSGTNIVCTIKSKKASSKIIKATKGKTYYYKVRAYKTIKINDKLKKIYGPWSKVKKYKRL